MSDKEKKSLWERMSGPVAGAKDTSGDQSAQHTQDWNQWYGRHFNTGFYNNFRRQAWDQPSWGWDDPSSGTALQNFQNRFGESSIDPYSQMVTGKDSFYMPGPTAYPHAMNPSYNVDAGIGSYPYGQAYGPPNPYLRPQEVGEPIFMVPRVEDPESSVTSQQPLHEAWAPESYTDNSEINHQTSPQGDVVPNYPTNNPEWGGWGDPPQGGAGQGSPTTISEGGQPVFPGQPEGPAWDWASQENMRYIEGLKGPMGPFENMTQWFKGQDPRYVARAAAIFAQSFTNPQAATQMTQHAYEMDQRDRHAAAQMEHQGNLQNRRLAAQTQIEDKRLQQTTNRDQKSESKELVNAMIKAGIYDPTRHDPTVHIGQPSYDNYMNDSRSLLNNHYKVQNEITELENQKEYLQLKLGSTAGGRKILTHRGVIIQKLKDAAKKSSMPGMGKLYEETNRRALRRLDWIEDLVDQASKDPNFDVNNYKDSMDRAVSVWDQDVVLDGRVQGDTFGDFENRLAEKFGWDE